MYRHKPRTVIGIWLAEISILLVGGCLLWAFLAAFGQR